MAFTKQKKGVRLPGYLLLVVVVTMIYSNSPEGFIAGDCRYFDVIIKIPIDYSSLPSHFHTHNIRPPSN